MGDAQLNTPEHLLEDSSGSGSPLRRRLVEQLARVTLGLCRHHDERAVARPAEGESQQASQPLPAGGRQVGGRARGIVLGEARRGGGAVRLSQDGGSAGFLLQRLSEERGRGVVHGDARPPLLRRE